MTMFDNDNHDNGVDFGVDDYDDVGDGDDDEKEEGQYNPN